MLSAPPRSQALILPEHFLKLGFQKPASTAKLQRPFTDIQLQQFRVSNATSMRTFNSDSVLNLIAESPFPVHKREWPKATHLSIGYWVHFFCGGILLYCDLPQLPQIAWQRSSAIWQLQGKRCSPGCPYLTALIAHCQKQRLCPPCSEPESDCSQRWPVTISKSEVLHFL